MPLTDGYRATFRLYTKLWFLQVVGTIVLALFSFYGIKISDNNDAYLEGIQKIEISMKWLRASQDALLALVLGLVLSGGVSLASIP